MDSVPFASLAQIRILLVPVGKIPKQTFEKWASLIRSFDNLRLDEIPPENREDKSRFIATPLSSGYLHLAYPSHPPPQRHNDLSLFRLSHFPLGVIGIAESSGAESLSSILAEFNAAIAEYFLPNSAFPLATKCYVFESDDDQSSQINLGGSLPQLVVIPSVMGNKKIYVGTLLAELCADILGDFTGLANALESPAGIEALNAKLLPTLAHAEDPIGTPLNLTFNHKELARVPSPSPYQLNALSSSSARSSMELSSRSRNGLSVPKRSSTTANLPTLSSNRASLVASGNATKKRNSMMGPTQSGRLNKIIADLYLLAGRTADAVQWYVESLPLLRGAQDVIWNASAIEGMCVAEVLDAWSAGDENAALSAPNAKQPWSDIADRLSQAAILYSRANPFNSPFSPPSSPVSQEHELSTLSLLYTEAALRQAQILLAVWSCKGWSPLTFKMLLQPSFPPTFVPVLPPESHLLRLSSATSISRTSISNTLSQVHGPFLMHLEPHDRLRVLNDIAAMYSCLGYKRKEVYILREVMATIMDLIVTAREEAAVTGKLEFSSNLASGQGRAGLGIAGLEVDASGFGRDHGSTHTSPATGSVAVRAGVSNAGNPSILKIVRYVCEVFGIKLDKVSIIESDGTLEASTTQQEIGNGNDLASGALEVNPYGWPELQLGVVREAVAVAEALPDHPTVAQFALSTLKVLHPYLTASEQSHLYLTSVKALATARRRGDDRRMEYWAGKPVISVEISPLPVVRLPIEHPINRLQAEENEIPIIAAGGKDLFIYNPRDKLASTSQAVAVQNEPMEFALTLHNPFAFDLELQSLSLSTSGPNFVSPSTSALIPSEAFRIVNMTGTATEPGTLILRGIKAQLSGGTFKEFLLPLLSDEDEGRAEKKKSLRDCEVGRTKWFGLDARDSAVKERESRAIKSGADTLKSKGPSKQTEYSFLTCKIVEEQPLLRVKRATLTQGAVMLYDGETTIIRLTLENISTLPVDFIKLTFDDSTIAPIQQVLQDGDVDALDAYDLEWDLVNRPVFSWDVSGNNTIRIEPGKKSIIGVRCLGKFGCSSGTIQISYSNAHRTRTTPADVFHTRQIIYPVLVTVYHTLECSSMDVAPYWHSSDYPEDNEDLADEDRSRKILLSSTTEAASNEEWCLLTLDVRNGYGVPFEVTFERNQHGVLSASTSRLVSPGSTSRIVLPLKRLSLPYSTSSAPIPTISQRQFVVSKSKLSKAEELLQRELFWYREELFKAVKAKWRQPGTTRHGGLYLQKQRLSPSMLETIRTPRCRIAIGIDGSTGIHPIRNSRKWMVPGQEFVSLKAHVSNHSDDALFLRLSYVPFPLTSMEPVLFDGSISQIPIGKLEPGESTEAEVGVCFVDEGKFEFSAEVHGYPVTGGESPSPAVEVANTTICIIVKT